jgi:signal transduction histidine kinase
MPFNHSPSSSQHLSPRRIITIGVLFALICIAISTTLAIETRWLGISFAPDEEGLRVTRVQSDGPAYERLHSGDIVTAIADPGRAPYALHGLDIMEDPYDLQLYREFSDFFGRQSAIYNRLNQPEVHLILADGHSVSLQPAPHRPLSSLPFLFWFQLGCGFVSLMIGIGVYAFRQEEIATRCFAASAIGLMAIITAAAMYSTRELAIDGELFYRLTLINQYGTVLFVALGTAVLWYSPRRISPLPMASMLLALYGLFALLHTLAVWESLNTGIRFPIFFFVLLIIVFSFFSWRSTRGRPASRAALKWLLYSWFTGIVLFFSLRLIPVALGLGSLIPQAAAWLVLVFIYVGVALGITRYRLFNLDRWVLRAWFWIFSGLAVIGVDISLVSLLDINTPLATAIALAVIGWIYFPLRQVLWARYAPGLNRIDFENLFPEILEMTLSPGQDRELFDKWQDMLQRVYEPLEIRPLAAPETASLNKVRINRNGISLQLPALPGGSALELSGAEHADRLFNPNDIRFANAIWGLFNHAVQFRLALERGAHEERQRIARDLHDDVAARLLTLVHRSDDAGYEKLARQALGALRDTIYTLGTQSPSPLEDLLADMRHEIQQRLEAIDIQLHWHTSGNMEGITLNARQHINLQRILQELVSNVIHHTQASKLSFDIDIQPHQLHIAACDNGIGGDIQDWTLGKGLNNIKNRVGELKGDVKWQDKEHGCCVILNLPLQ